MATFCIGHSRSSVFLYYFLNGYNFMESAIHASLIKIWSAVLGDPLIILSRREKLNKRCQHWTFCDQLWSFEWFNDKYSFDYASHYCKPWVVHAFVLGKRDKCNYTDTIHRDTLYFAHHMFKLDSLSKDSAYGFRSALQTRRKQLVLVRLII